MVDGQSRSGNAYHKGRNESFSLRTLWPKLLCPGGNSFSPAGARVLEAKATGFSVPSETVQPQVHKGMRHKLVSMASWCHSALEVHLTLVVLWLT